MKIDKSLFRSKLAQRIFLMFVACALLPIVGLFILSFTQVTKQLYYQSHIRLRQSAKSHGLTLYERLLFLEAEMQLFASTLDLENPEDIRKFVNAEYSVRLVGRFSGIFLYQSGIGYQPFFGEPKNIPHPNVPQHQHLSTGKTSILLQYNPDALPRVFLLRQINLKYAQDAFLVGEVNPYYMWGGDYENTLPPGVDVCVLDESRQILFSSFPDQKDLSTQAAAALTSSTSDLFELTLQNEKYLASRWTMFLKPKFLVLSWTVVLLQSEADVLAPISNFQKMFVLVVLMALWVVLLLSIRFIRRSLGPLELLKEGTRRIAHRDFDCQVKVNSKDEFEELAESFNQMSSRLSRQFKTLVTKAEIDRAILSSLKTETIVKTVISRLRECFSFDAISIGLFDSDIRSTVHLYSGSGLQGSKINETSATITADEFQRLEENTDFVFIDEDQEIPAYLVPIADRGIDTFLVLPVFLKRKLSAILAFGPYHPKAPSEEEFHLARQIADQVAVALSNSELIEELNRLNWGTLKALARAVDAKSSWTACHSGRVANIALQIGRVLQLDSKALENLHRAALLHDIGKLGVPAAVLDKPGKLSDEEFRMIKSHSTMGARILEPIKAYADIIPMVLQHHERFDGKGYPDGLYGDNIDLGARIMAVADVYDALKSDRPYREGWHHERVIEIITKEAKHQFDPRIVAALLTIIELKVKRQLNL
jgi:putative nucleotidyltransferase with HDIG domain